MKKITYSLSLLALCSVLILTACGGDDDEGTKELTEQQKAAKALKAGSPWIISSVDSKPDGTDDEALAGLQMSFGTTGSDLTLAPGSFSSSGPSSELSSEAGATWAWSGTGLTTIALDGGFTGELTDIKLNGGIENPTSVTVTFILADDGGRVGGFGGYTITLE